MCDMHSVCMHEYICAHTIQQFMLLWNNINEDCNLQDIITMNSFREYEDLDGASEDFETSGKESDPQVSSIYYIFA